MLPVIQESASFAFRYLPPEARQEAVQDVTVGALVAFVQLVKLGKARLAYPTVLARYGIAQFRCGRRVGSRLNVRDVSSRYAQRKKKFVVERLDRFCAKQNVWREVLVEDRRATPADIVAVRIDFADWLKSLSWRLRRIANLLATGETTGAAAKKFRVTPGRISQIRRELEQSWRTFQGEETSSAAVAAVGS
ncbi:MAG: hypothetical protein IH987_11940 [Planctomycetes bacterium]|nr:hypothetical protein [Planctomycetota bacterium]